MRAVIQRVSRASVEVGGAVAGEIERGLLLLVGIATDDTSDGGGSERALRVDRPASEVLFARLN